MSIASRFLELTRCGAAMLALASAGCAHFDCSRVTGDPALRIGRISGGEGPRVNIVEIFSDGNLRFQLLGSRSYCSKISPDEARDLLSLASPNALEALRDLPLGFDEPEAQIERDSLRLRVSLKEVPALLVPLFQRVDSVFGAAFGSRYDLPLLPKKEG